LSLRQLAIVAITLTDNVRNKQNNWALGGILAFIAGAVNAGGFLAGQRYTSHMTGIISGIADDLVISEIGIVLAGIAFLISFVSGAAVTAILINWARRKQLHSEFALSLCLEAVLLLVFGILGFSLNILVDVFVPTTILVLCFVMGLQNAIMTKISKAEIRTTHMTGIVTDIGIELGRLLYWNRDHSSMPQKRVVADREKLRVHLIIFSLFLIGAIVGATSFKHFGYVTTVPIAGFLILISLPHIKKDLIELWRTKRSSLTKSQST
jgi:uncharacterized membrane protein YoaK (UPF0700 family)